MSDPRKIESISVSSLAAQELLEWKLLPPETLAAIGRPDSLGVLLPALELICPPGATAVEGPLQRTWECVGLVYRDLGRFHEALSIFKGLYYQMLRGQQETGTRRHKGTPLCWISDCYLVIGYPLMSLRYLMLTLVEDAITARAGDILPQQTGVYWRLISRGALSEQDLNRYAREFQALATADPTEAFFPEFVLQKTGRQRLAYVRTDAP